VTAVIILGLGIGMSVAMFTIFETVLVRRLPVANHGRIAVMETYPQPDADFVVGPKYLVPLRHHSRTIRDIAAVARLGTNPVADHRWQSCAGAQHRPRDRELLRGAWRARCRRSVVAAER